MRTVSLKELQKVSKHRPPGYLEEVLAQGQVKGAVVVFDNAVYYGLRKKFSPHVVDAAKRAANDGIKQLGNQLKGSTEWPIFLKPLKLLAKEGDRGLGDIVVRIIGEAESEAFQKWYLDTFGKSCGCKRRQDYLNKRYPLS